RVAATLEVRKKRPGLFRALCEHPETAPAGLNILAAVESARHRFQTPGFTGYEGRLAQPDSLRRLQQHFSADYEFSTTQFERYALCPFRFFVSDVLKIQPPEPVEIATDYRGRGTVVHN